ncbi:MAG: hypothetical protein HY286_07320 [Planctomycetes bacterium]|nr:hypothetical protein [Planctomycetota bacterium]
MTGFFNDQQLPENIAAFFSWFHSTADRSKWNIEEALSFLFISESRRHLWGEFGDPAYHGRLVRFDEVVKEVIGVLKIDTFPEHCDKHVSLVKTLHPRDSIISLNYDLICDQSLLHCELPNPSIAIDSGENLNWSNENSRMGKLAMTLGISDLYAGGQPMTLMPGERESGFYLKLHGSIDWLYCPTESCLNNRVYFPSCIYPTYQQSQGNPCRRCGSSLRTMIIPPVGVIQFDSLGRLSFLWSLALRELISADKIIAFGLSVAPSDFEFHWLVRQASRLRPHGAIDLNVINSNRDHAERFVALCGSSGAQREYHYYSTVEGYLRRCRDNTIL